MHEKKIAPPPLHYAITVRVPSHAAPPTGPPLTAAAARPNPFRPLVLAAASAAKAAAWSPSLKPGPGGLERGGRAGAAAPPPSLPAPAPPTPAAPRRKVATHQAGDPSGAVSGDSAA